MCAALPTAATHDEDVAGLRARLEACELELQTARAALASGAGALPVADATTAQRAAALDAALAALEVAPAALEASAAALAAYAAFVELPPPPPSPPRASRTDAGARAALAARVALDTAARAAAHALAHGLRREASSAAEFIRSTDDAHAAAAAGGVSGPLLPAHSLVLVLDNVRSAYNVGSLLRTADTARATEILTCGYTPTVPHPKIDKTAFAASRSVPVRHFESTLAAVRALQAAGYAVWAMETTARSACYAAVPFPPRVALVLGNEEVGVDPAVLALCDGLVEIPTFGLKNSLNVASAAPVVVFECLRQWGVLGGGAQRPVEARGLSGAQAGAQVRAAL